MVRLTPEHFEVIDSNKAKAHEDRKEMKKELTEFIDYKGCTQSLKD